MKRFWCRLMVCAICTHCLASIIYQWIAEFIWWWSHGHRAKSKQIFVRTLLLRYRSRTSSSPIRSIYSVTFSIETMWDYVCKLYRAEMPLNRTIQAMQRNWKCAFDIISFIFILSSLVFGGTIFVRRYERVYTISDGLNGAHITRNVFSFRLTKCVWAHLGILCIVQLMCFRPSAAFEIGNIWDGGFVS